MTEYNKLLQERGNILINLGEHAYWLYRNNKIDLSEFGDLLKELEKIDKDIFKIHNGSAPEQISDVCPSCNEKLEGGNIKFCSYCGTNINEFYSQNTTRCTSCESIISINDKFCGICGSKQKEDI